MAIPSTTSQKRFAERLYPLGYPVLVETDDAGAAELVETLWGGWLQLVSGEPLRITIHSRPDEGILQAPNQIDFQITETGFLMKGATFHSPALHLEIRTPISEHFLNTALLTALDFSLFTPLHAACVVQNGLGVILCGDSGAGKSTLAYACARRGWTLVSDDSLHALPGLGRMVASFSSIIHLREPARALFPELHRQHVGIAPNGKPAMEILAGQFGLLTARRACVERTVLLARRPGPARVTALEPDTAVQYFCKYLWQPDLHHHRIRLREIVNHTGALLLEYERIEDAVEALEDLLKQEGLAA